MPGSRGMNQEATVIYLKDNEDLYLDDFLVSVFTLMYNH